MEKSIIERISRREGLLCPANSGFMPISADCKNAFSAAEMLIVLLILAFLILALPPLVHKKVAKRIIRGEHGRYECWRDPATGTLKEYYATEKGGIADGYTIDGKTVLACHFNPQEQAPNATYFSFQAIGGGAGGSYPPYNVSSTTYKNAAYTETVKIYLGKGCCSETGYKTNTEVQEDKCHVSGYKCTGTDVTLPGCSGHQTYSYSYTDSDGTQHGPQDGCSGIYGIYEVGAMNQECRHYQGSYKYALTHFENQLGAHVDTSWIQYYWVPVPGTGTIKICSGKGYTGQPVYGTQTVDRGEDRSPYKFIYHYGGAPGNGACWVADASKFYLDKDNRFIVMNSVRPSSGKYFYGTDGQAANEADNYVSPHMIVTSTESNWSNTTPVYLDAKVRGSDGELTWQTPKIADVAHRLYNNGHCGNNYLSNYVTAEIEGSHHTGTRCLVGPGLNGKAATESSDNSTYMIDANPNSRGSNSLTTCNSPWTKYSNVTDTVDASVDIDKWPSLITITRSYGYDTPTLGYAGSPGTSVGMFLPKFMGDLTFAIGEAGAAGTANSKQGGNGGDTVVYSGGSTILTAKGGVGKAGGELGGKVAMFGRDTMFGRNASETRYVNDASAENPTDINIDEMSASLGRTNIILGRPQVNSICESGVTLDEVAQPNGQIDGCLDKIVARDNPKRFAEDSGFYTVLELDTNSRTTSALYRLYGSDGTGIMPGTAGDGGYTFLRSLSGTENITYTNHTISGLNTTFNYELTNDQNYTCYRKGDSLGNASGETVAGDVTVCAPTQGYPGAVVIVW